MSQTNKKTRFLPFLHLLAILTLAAWWATYVWIQSPARDISRLSQPRAWAELTGEISNLLSGHDPRLMTRTGRDRGRAIASLREP